MFQEFQEINQLNSQSTYLNFKEIKAQNWTKTLQTDRSSIGGFYGLGTQIFTSVFQILIHQSLDCFGALSYEPKRKFGSFFSSIDSFLKCTSNMM